MTNSTMTTPNADTKIVVTAEQIQTRVREIGQQISKDYSNKSLCAVCVIENAFVFMGDLVRAISVPMVCQFIKPYFREMIENNVATTEILFSPEMEVAGKDVLLVEGIMNSGVTTEFLIRNFTTRGAASVKSAVLLDRESYRRVSLKPDYVGFPVDEKYVYGYGLGTPELDRNLPYIAAKDIEWSGVKH